MNGFALWIGLGASFGLAWVAFQAERTEKASLHRLHELINAGLALLVGALVGGRAAYALVNWAYYGVRPLEVFQVWLGGLAWPGVILGALLGLAFYAWWIEGSLAILADHMLPLALTLTLSSWLASWQSGIAYGRLVDAWWGMPAVDEWGEMQSRFPVQFAAAVATLIVFWGIDLLRKRLQRPGQAAGLALVCLAVELLAVSFLRADTAPVWLGIRLDTWSAIVFLGFALVWCIFVFFPLTRKKLETLDSNHPS